MEADKMTGTEIERARKIKFLEIKIQQIEENIRDEKNGGSKELVEHYEFNIHNIQLQIRRLRGEELSGLTKNEIEYYDDTEVCYNCAELLESHHVVISFYRCRLLKDDDNFVRPSAHCNLWKKAFRD
jgi:hypothetical protein